MEGKKLFRFHKFRWGQLFLHLTLAVLLICMVYPLLMSVWCAFKTTVDYDGVFIPNWAMWYGLELAAYADRAGEDEIVRRSRESVLGIIAYFRRFENEFSLLEDLEGWVFVEWSAANDADRVCGVNVPSNFCYAALLERVGRLYGIAEWVQKAAAVRNVLRELACDGVFFADNLVRDERGSLKRTDRRSEVCQYYAFWFDGISREDYPELFSMLVRRLGPRRKNGEFPALAPPNMMYGIYMRLDLLMRAGMREQLFEECLYYFLKMAERTGTLWENNDVRASCNHGFAAYAAKWLIYVLTGYDAAGGELPPPQESGIGVDCDLYLPRKGGYLHLRVDRNRVFVSKEEEECL